MINNIKKKLYMDAWTSQTIHREGTVKKSEEHGLPICQSLAPLECTFPCR